MRDRWLFSYVVDHDEGYSPNPVGGFCTLANCKFSQSNRWNMSSSRKKATGSQGPAGEVLFRQATVD
jgi:hypothetical protein